MTRADAGERRYLNDVFAELCAIPSPFGAEGRCAERVAAELRSLGLEVEEDGAAAESGAECGNLLTRIPGADPGVMLCAHLDTVAVNGPVEPVVVDGGWQNARPEILGADNKAAVAVLLAIARRCVAAGSPVALELLFTVSEENALAGAKAFDVRRLRSPFGYVFDHASAIGEVILASPAYYRLLADFRGAAAHAGIRPEDGRSAILAAARAIGAMRLGRLDDETTANVGTVEGGAGGTNVVPERCRVQAEARSLDTVRAEETAMAMVECLEDGAAAAECDVEVTVERLFEAYRTRPSAPPVVAAEEALSACGYTPRRVVTGGGSDANAFEAAGYPCVLLANGTERNHEPDERVSVAALEGMLDVGLELLESVARC